ncbi:MAG: hypothetical protein E6I64_06705, partial [Chloroflexi bacterium]
CPSRTRTARRSAADRAGRPDRTRRPSRAAACRAPSPGPGHLLADIPTVRARSRSSRSRPSRRAPAYRAASCPSWAARRRPR